MDEVAKVTLAAFRERFPELSERSDDDVNVAIDQAFWFHCASEEGQLLAAAHLVSVDELREVQRSEDGEVKVSFFRFGRPRSMVAPSA